MIGQILGGSSPNVAIKYQMMIMVITFTASMLSLMITISLASRRSFDAYGKLLEVSKEAVMMDALDAGADDFNAEDNVFEITTDPDAFNDVVKALEEKNYAFVSADISLVPQTYVKLESDEDIKNMEKLLDMLEDNEDVQNTYHNWDQD